MNNVKTLKVDIKDHAYDIHIGEGLLKDLSTYVPKHLEETSCFFICDDHTEHYAKQIARTHPVFMVKSGEQAKSIAIYQEVLSFLLDHKIGRKSVIYAVGGGVIGDLAGFAAASVLRGVPVIQIPTSLLAMVDSSVGGKTGINMPQGKNLVGAFHQPSAVICDFDVLKTLPERELKAGYAEMLKYALLGDKDFFEWLEEHAEEVLNLEKDSLTYAVKRSCEMKAEIVIADEKELTGQRALLNLGHTFAHAFEAVMKYDGRLLHGEAVAVGIVCAMELSISKGIMNAQQVERVTQHLNILGLKRSLQDIGLPDDISAETLLDIMRGDKKAQDGRINFILMRGIGNAFVTDSVKDAECLEILNHMMGK